MRHPGGSPLRPTARRLLLPAILGIIAIPLLGQPSAPAPSLAANLVTLTPTSAVLVIPTGTIPVPALPVPSKTPTAGPPTATPTVTATASATATSTATATATAASTKPVPIQDQPPPRHYVVLIVIDAARAMYFNYAQMPHLRALMKNGVVYDRAFVGQLESSTPGVHVTLGTGTVPRQNGFLGFGWASADSRKWVDFRTLLANGQIDPVLKSLGVPSVAQRLHQFIPSAKSLAASGHKDYATVGLGGGAADYEIYGKFVGKQFIPAFLHPHAPPPLTPAERASLTVKSPLPRGAEDAWAFRYASIVARHVTPHLLMLNLPETDTWGHWYGPNDRTVFGNLMKNVDNGIGEIESTYRDLGILNRTDFIITADHAMMQSLPAFNWKHIQAQIATSGAQIIRADGSAGGIWLKDPSQAKIAAQKVVEMTPQHVEAVFYRNAIGNNYQYLLASPIGWLVNKHVADALSRLVNTTAGVDGPDLWVLTRENYTFDANNTSGKWKGTHGGATWKVQHIPLIISGADIRQGVHSQFPARSMDIAPTMERLLGLPAFKRDGTVLADAFTHPLAGELDGEKAVSHSLSADVTALAAQSVADDRGIRWPSVPGPIYHCGNKHDPNCQNTADTAANG
jgi:arylsulfatase A-like enzyme